MRDSAQDQVQDLCVHEVEVREVADRRALERAVPRVRALEVRAEREVPERFLVVVQDCPHLTHVCEAIVVFGTENESAQSAERRLEQNGKCSVQC